MTNPLGSDPIQAFGPELDPRHDHTYASEAPKRLIEQYRGRNLIEGLVKVFAGRWQRIEDAAWEVIVFRRIELAEGVTLDKLGAIVRRGRNGLPDKSYRIAIRAQIRILRSSGKPEDMIAIARLSTPAGTALSYREEHPAGVRFEVQTRVKFSIPVLWTALRLSKPAGVRVGLVFSQNVRPGRWFKLSSSTSASETSTNHGFGNLFESSTGGKLRDMKVSAP